MLIGYMRVSKMDGSQVLDLQKTLSKNLVLKKREFMKT